MCLLSTTARDVIYEYDELNRLIKATVNGKTTEYIYNGDGLRVGKIEDGKTTRYLYEFDKVVLEVGGNGNQTARNIYGLNLLAREVYNGTIAETMYYLYNGHADVTALVGETGEVVGTYYYDAFGNILEATGDKDNNIMYAGYQYDDETGLYYLNARFYDPKVARFLQEDTYTGDPMDPLSLNLYSYCHNEPIMYSDPSGHIRRNEFDLRKDLNTYGENTITVKVNSDDVDRSLLPVRKKITNKSHKDFDSIGYDNYPILVVLYDPTEDFKILENLKKDFYNTNSFFKKCKIISKMVSKNWDIRFKNSSAQYQAKAYNELGLDPSLGKAAFEGAISYGAAEIVFFKGWIQIRPPKGSTTVGSEVVAETEAVLAAKNSVPKGTTNADFIVAPDGTVVKAQDYVTDTARMLPEGTNKMFNNGGVLDNANFAQKKFNAAGKFSDGGIEYWEKTLGRRVETMEELKALIKSGEVEISQVPIDYIVRDGNTLILNTRSSQVLTELGIPRSQWNAINRTGQELYEINLTNQLARNKLTSKGIPYVVQSVKQ